MAGTDDVAERERVEMLFTALGADRLEEFVSGCSERLLITMRGSGAASTILSRAQLPEWWEGFRSLTEGSLRSDVVLTMTSGAAHVVALRHTFVLDGRPRRYETINSFTFRQGSIASWFSRPLDPHGYAEAWGIRPAPTTMPVRTGGRVGGPLVRGTDRN
jgi:ketosteroid isomerase-like protein